MRAAIYTRISRDPDSDSCSPDRQEALCRSLAHAREFEVVNVFTDRGKSAWNPTTKRPGWKALKEAVAQGEADVVMAYSLTRLGRRVRDLLDLSEYLKEYRCALVVVDMNLDTTTSGGQLIYTVIAALAQLESEQISERVKSHTDLAARQGRMHTGGKRQFGYRRDATVDRKEAEAVQRTVDRFLSGTSLRQCAAALNAEGHRTTGGSEWSGRTVRQMLRSPRIAGLRKHNDKLLPGAWEPIITPDRWSEMQGRIESRPGRTISVRRHLLSGIATCGLCGKTMAAHLQKARPDGRASLDRYVCISGPGRPGCGRVAASMASLERVVVERFFDFMSKAEFLPVDTGGQSLAEVTEAIAEAEARLTQLAHDHYVGGRLSEDMFAQTYDELTDLIAGLQRSRRAIESRSERYEGALRPGSREDIEAWWKAASLPDRRAALQRALTKVTVNRAKHRGGNQFDEGRVEITWSWDVYIDAMQAEWDRLSPEEQEESNRRAAEDDAVLHEGWLASKQEEANRKAAEEDAALVDALMASKSGR